MSTKTVILKIKAFHLVIEKSHKNIELIRQDFLVNYIWN